MHFGKKWNPVAGGYNTIYEASILWTLRDAALNRAAYCSQVPIGGGVLAWMRAMWAVDRRPY